MSDFMERARKAGLARMGKDTDTDWTVDEAKVLLDFLAGVQWALDQEPTDDEVGHAYAEWMNHGPISDLDARRLNCTCGERGFTPPGYEIHRLRAALTAARAARRDKEKR